MLDKRSRELISQKVTDGGLGAADNRATFGGRSAGETCAACERPIKRGDMDIETSGSAARSQSFVHVACHEYLGVLTHRG